MKHWKKNILIPTVSLFAICLVTTLLLALTNMGTEKKISDLAVKTAEEAQKKVLSEAEAFQEKTIEVDGVKYTYQEGLKEGKTVGYVFTTNSNGYGGMIKIMTGVSVEGKVSGLEFLEINETAGLGMNAQKDSFKGQFSGKSAGLEAVKSGAGENQIQAMTGATITSRAVTKAVNEALSVYSAVTGGQNNG